MNHRAKTVLNIIFLTVFLLCLLIPLFLTDRREGLISDIDNRALTEAPEIGTEGFTDDFESYLQDRIGLRSKLVNAYAILNDVTTGELTNPVYTYGKNGYVFFHMHDNIPYSDYHEIFAQMVKKLQTYCEARGTKFYFLFNPEKISIYRQYLPEGVNYEDAWVDQLIARMEELGIPCVNTTDLLTEKSKTEQVFNVKYDAGHWNDLGCFYATNALLDRIHEDIPEMQELQMDDFNITEKLETKLPVSDFPIHEEVPSFELKTGWEDLTDSWNGEVVVDPEYPHFHDYRNMAEGAEALPRVLFFQGSYYNRGPQFLVSRTSEYVGVHSYQNVMNLDYYYNLFHPDVVILDAAEYVLSDLYFDSEVMADMDLNPALAQDNESPEALMRRIRKTGVSYEAETYAGLSCGQAVDTVEINRHYPEARYAWLVTQDQAYDLRISEGGTLTAAVRHGLLTEGEKMLLVTEDGSGELIYTDLEARQ